MRQDRIEAAIEAVARVISDTFTVEGELTITSDELATIGRKVFNLTHASESGLAVIPYDPAAIFIPDGQAILLGEESHELIKQVAKQNLEANDLSASYREHNRKVASGWLPFPFVRSDRDE